MQREIKFRGFSKRFIPNEWFYGDLVNYIGEKYILPEGQDVWDIIGDGVEVHSESVGQFTGLYDKNGKEIYEGDILAPISKVSFYYVGFESGMFCIYNNLGRWATMERGIEIYKELNIDFEIIGNIYENPELLK
ncbi:YopX family protein [Capnocytophaga canimorsus]|uniref:Protein containing YopX domain protein n=1 Tax=Capnocytophaga canimorsus TaxID=28188 RepID=A0A0B7HT05_9FLAO|nr:YopX family protein [Capnocytophaga canimorsus]ATA76718.1 hypothetical protein CGC47_03505 [Capnocytophaga canimorsus]AWL78178.1 hypothetical protein DKB58_04075 [Capnocytophaga canimorsus]AYW36811.1 hypothetical protein D8L92_05525 [Capnocytophaga canimorsus]MDT9499501.1 YopX family protein [Capnocytophaga canimorsus]PJI84170.1 putative phage protein (TIGR01671 family) [Capnocytophaga canimorsus]